MRNLLNEKTRDRPVSTLDAFSFEEAAFVEMTLLRCGYSFSIINLTGYLSLIDSDDQDDRISPTGGHPKSPLQFYDIEGFAYVVIRFLLNPLKGSDISSFQIVNSYMALKKTQRQQEKRKQEIQHKDDALSIAIKIKLRTEVLTKKFESDIRSN